MRPKRWIARTLWSALIFLAIIGSVAATRRTIVLLFPGRWSSPHNPAVSLDGNFARHRILTLVHILPGLLFMVLGPLQFASPIRWRHLRFHRWSGRIFVGSGLVIGVSALIMSFKTAIGGVNETAATTLFALIFLFDLGKAFLHIRHKEIAQHREWMIRAFAIGLAVATIRPIVALFFAFTPVTHLAPQQFFGPAFWIGFTLHLIAAEIFINYTRPRPQLVVTKPVAGLFSARETLGGDRMIARGLPQ